MSAYRRIEVPSPETVIDGHKRCRRCYEVRPLTDFYRVSDLRIRQGGHKDGLSYTCKRCQIKRMNKRTNGLKLNGPTKIVQEKQCAKCKIIQPHFEFYLNKSQRDWLDPVCKKCHQEHRANPETPIKQRKWHLSRGMASARMKLLIFSPSSGWEVCDMSRTHQFLC